MTESGAGGRDEIDMVALGKRRRGGVSKGSQTNDLLIPENRASGVLTRGRRGLPAHIDTSHPAVQRFLNQLDDAWIGFEAMPHAITPVPKPGQELAVAADPVDADPHADAACPACLGEWDECPFCGGTGVVAAWRVQDAR